jgi:hypothetical protein
MKPRPAPEVAGNTQAKRMDSALRIVLSVPKDALLKQEKRLKQARAKKRKTS